MWLSKATLKAENVMTVLMPLLGVPEVFLRMIPLPFNMYK